MKTPAKKPSSKPIRPNMSVEWTREQVLLRTGYTGPGQSIALKFRDHGGDKAAIKKGEKWVQQELAKRGLS